MSFKDRWNKVARKTVDNAKKAAQNTQKALDVVGDVAEISTAMTVAGAKKAAQSTSELVDKSMDKAIDLTEHEKTPKYVGKIIEKATQPKTAKDLAVEGAIGLVVGVATGGALLPVILSTAGHTYAGKKVVDKFNARKEVRKAAQNDNAAAKPPVASAPKKPATKKKSGPRS